MLSVSAQSFSGAMGTMGGGKALAGEHRTAAPPTPGFIIKSHTKKFEKSLKVLKNFIF